MSKKQKTFEEALAQLEQIVARLEESPLPLEEALELFKSGLQLTKICRDTLQKAEKDLQVLLKDTDGNFQLTDFDKPV